MATDEQQMIDAVVLAWLRSNPGLQSAQKITDSLNWEERGNELKLEKITVLESLTRLGVERDDVTFHQVDGTTEMCYQAAKPSSLLVAEPERPNGEVWTTWNGAPCEATKVRVIVADDPRFPHYWARGLAGTERRAVKVTQNGTTFYLDDDNWEPDPVADKDFIEAAARLGVKPEPHRAGSAWELVRGGGSGGHSELEVEREVEWEDDDG